MASELGAPSGVSTPVQRIRRLFVVPMSLGDRRLPPLGVTVLAGIGATLLVIVAWYRWAVPSDEFAYWQAAQRLVAGQPPYDPNAVPGTPYAYWYPPPLAQMLAPFTLVVPDGAFVAAWTLLLLGCLWFLGGGHPLTALALVAYPFVAVELWFRNVHLLLAVLVVLALRRSPLFWIPATAIKVTPVLGLVYLAAAGRWRSVAVVSAVGGGVLLVSVVLSPSIWTDFVAIVLSQGTTSGSSLLPVPYLLRFAVAAGLAAFAGRLGGARGEVLLVVALVVGNPTLWATALSMLIAAVPLVRASSRGPTSKPSTEHAHAEASVPA